MAKSAETAVNRRIALVSRPVGEPSVANFALGESPMPKAGPGELLVRTIWLSLAPYMRWRMGEEKSYAPPVPLGDVMVGGTLGEVVQSNHPGFKAGDIVLGGNGWQEYAVSDGKGLRKIDRAAGPITSALGVLGLSGMTAYTGLFSIGAPKPGETVVVAAASGAVGALVGQFAKLRGARAVGIAGGPEKCAFVAGDLGYDACIDHRDPDLAGKLKAACPNGIDVYFENVGGKVWDAVLPLLNDYARVPVCGVISLYNSTTPPPGPDKVPGLMTAILRRRLTIRGFLVTDFLDQQEEFERVVGAWQREGKLRYREDIVDGLENAPAALVGLLQGKNFGKLLVRVGPDPA